MIYQQRMLTLAVTVDKDQEEDQEVDRLTVSKKHASNRTYESETHLSWFKKENALRHLIAQVESNRKKDCYCCSLSLIA
jgi:hypothetical protein